MSATQIAIGKIVAVHGIQGAVKIKPYRDGVEDILKTTPLTTQTGDAIALKVVAKSKTNLVAKIKDVGDRNLAMTFIGTELFIPRDAFPVLEEEDSYYITDLIGMDVYVEDACVGRIQDVENYGAGDLLTVQEKQNPLKTLQIPFQKEYILEVDDTQRRVYVDKEFYEALKALNP